MSSRSILNHRPRSVGERDGRSPVRHAGLGDRRGFTWALNSQGNRLTPWSNDPVSDPPGDAVYIRDDDTETSGRLRRRRSGSKVRIASATVRATPFSSTIAKAIEQELTTFVPVDVAGGAPLRLQRLRLRNRSSRRRLSVTSYTEWVLGEDRDETQMHIVTNWDVESSPCSREIRIILTPVTDCVRGREPASHQLHRRPRRVPWA